MNITRALRPLFVTGFAAVLLSGCETSGVTSSSPVSVHPRQAVWRCGDNVSLQIQKTSEGLAITDSRGFDVVLPPDPPGQTIRYGKTGYAFVIEGRTASWFATKRLPADCRR